MNLEFEPAKGSPQAMAERYKRIERITGQKMQGLNLNMLTTPTITTKDNLKSLM